MQWLMWNAYKWGLRLVVLTASCWTLQRMLSEEMGYRVEMQHIVIVAALTIVTVRLWMPWRDSA